MKKRPTCRQFTVTFQDGSVLDLLPHLPKNKEGIVMNPSRHTRDIVAQHRPDRLREYDQAAQARAMRIDRIVALIERG